LKKENDKIIITPFVWVLTTFFLLLGGGSWAEQKHIALYAPDSLTGTGVLKHILPRFSLKHNIRVGMAPIQAQADVVLSEQKAGSPAFQNGSEIWYVSVQGEGASDFAETFIDWITSDIGKSAIESFVSSNGITFSTQFDAALLTPQETELVDVTLGHQIAMKNCGRCHAIDETNRKKTIGSTPSFAALRTFQDWEIRFEAFFTLNPHPSFTQIEDVSEPFSEGSPPPISPIFLTLEELDEIIAYARQVMPADLGQSIQSN